MKKPIEFVYSTDVSRYRYDAILDTTIQCPLCGIKNSFEFLTDGIGANDSEINYIAQCSECKKFFIAKYANSPNHGSKYSDQRLTAVFPNGKFKHSFPPDINKISNKFIEIYEQTMTAKNNGQNELVGLGLRKAFEFLIYDYIKDVLALEPAKTLEKRIEQISVQNVNVNATLVRWIGNDHTHVEIKHPEFSIDEMIESINMVVYYLYAEYKSKEVAEKIKVPQSPQ